MQRITKETFMLAALLLRVREDYEYEDGKRTDKRIGFTYDVVLPSDDFDGLKLSVKVASQAPVITSQELAKLKATKQRAFLTFGDLTIGTYVNKAGAATFTTNAQSVTLTDKDGVPVPATA